MAKLTLKRYRNREVAVAIGETESALTSFASAHERSTKNGWTIPEIVEFLERPNPRNRTSRPVDEHDVDEIRAALVCFGFKYWQQEQCGLTEEENEPLRNR